MAIYTYFRVSTQAQAEANGIQMQKDIVDRYVKEHNIIVDGSFEDLGISGTTTDRNGLIDLLSTLKENDKVIVANTSRLWRSDVAGVVIRKEIIKCKADIISVEQPTYSVYINDPNDYLINAIMQVLDVYDRMQVSMKLSKGRKAKAVNGSKACGTAPYGYKWDEAEIVIDYNNNLVVKDLFEHYTELKSLGKLQKYSIEKGYKTRNGKDFSKQALSNILHNDFYIGVVTHGDIKKSGNHEPIISTELFNSVNNILCD